MRVQIYTRSCIVAPSMKIRTAVVESGCGLEITVREDIDLVREADHPWAIHANAARIEDRVFARRPAQVGWSTTAARPRTEGEKFIAALAYALTLAAQWDRENEALDATEPVTQETVS